MRPTDPRWKVSNVAIESRPPNPEVVLHEHEGVRPRSYMAVSNLRTIEDAAHEILALLNEEDELPAWCEQLLAEAKSNLGKARDYVKSEKSAP